MAYKLLVINPGSTSTKVSYFENEKNVFTESIFHDAPELLKYPTTNDQLPMRRQVLLDFLKEHGIDPKQIDVFVGRGGCAYSQQAGVMTIDEKLVEDTAADCGGSDHPAKLGVMLAYDLCRTYGGKMYTVNPTNVDELCDYARPTGIAGLYRRAIPVMEVLQYLDEGHTTAEMRAMLSRSGGFVSHFGTSDAAKVHALVEAGDPKATTIWNTVIYQLCKSIGGMAAVLEGKVDGILLTGGLMRYDDILRGVEQRCGWIAPVSVYPGECEQEAMADAVLAVLRGEAKANTYTGKPVFSGFPWEREA